MSIAVYLAARYSRYEELQGYAEQLVEVGCLVTSRWIKGDHQVTDDQLKNLDVGEEAEYPLRVRFAEEDVLDLRAANVIVSFTEPPRSGPSRGGRHVEFGMALAMGKQVVVVGHRENVFHCLPQVAFFPVWEGALDHIRMLAYRQTIAHTYPHPPVTPRLDLKGDLL
jgi:hypothetical protein